MRIFSFGNLNLFKKMSTNSGQKPTTVSQASQTQLDFMNTEICILVDDQDLIRGQATKKECHLWKNVDHGGQKPEIELANHIFR